MTHAALKDLLDEVFALQAKHYGDGMTTHVELSKWAKKARAALSAMEGEAVAWASVKNHDGKPDALFHDKGCAERYRDEFDGEYPMTVRPLVYGDGGPAQTEPVGYVRMRDGEPVGELASGKVHAGQCLYTAPPPQQADKDLMQRTVDNVVTKVMDQREEILQAFVAKYGFQPDEAVQVIGHDGSWRVIRREEMFHPTPSPGPQKFPHEGLPADFPLEILDAAKEGTPDYWLGYLAGRKANDPPGPQGGGEAVAWISWSSAMMLRAAHEADTQQNVMAWAKPRGHDAIPLYVEATPPAHQPGEVCHCATCTCAPGMTPAVRFDTSPAEREGAVREHLISLGWTPPAAEVVPIPALAPKEAGHG